MVLIEGEAGIGKSRLLDTYLTSPSGRANRVLTAYCPAHRTPQTFAPLVTALGRAGLDVGELGLSPLVGALHPLLPEWADRLPPAPAPAADAGSARHRIYRALHEVLDAAGVDLLVVEDAHWADDATLEFLLYLNARPGDQPRLVLTCRPEDVPVGSALLRMSSHSSATAPVERLELTPLDVDATAELVSSMLSGETVSDEFAAFLHRHTDGIPLAIEETVRLLSDRGDLVQRRGEWVRRHLDRIEVPPTVRDAVVERTERQEATTQLLLRAAAVLDAPADEATLAAVAGLPEAESRAALAEAIRCGLMRETSPGHLAFGHALAAQATYEATPAPTRRALHRRAAAVLAEAPPTPLAQLARHCRDGGDTTGWCAFGEQAADLAVAVGDDETAAELLFELVTAASPPAQVAARLVAKIRFSAFPLATRCDDLVDALAALLDDPSLDPADAGVLSGQRGRVLMAAERYDEGHHELKRALVLLPRDSPDAFTAAGLLGMAFDTHSTVAEHRAWLDLARSLLADSPLGTEQLGALVNQATGRLMIGDGEGWELAAAIPAETNDAAERMQIARADLNIGNEALTWGYYEEAARRLERARSYATRQGHPRIEHDVQAIQTHLRWFTGEWSGLAETIEELLGLQDISIDARTEAMLVGLLLKAVQGGRVDFHGAVDAVVQPALRRGELEIAAWAAGSLARQLLGDDQVQAAVACSEMVASIVLKKGIWLLASELAAPWVEALARDGQLHRAQEWMAAYEVGAGGLEAPVARAGLVSARATLARHASSVDEAGPGFDQAGAGFDQTGAGFDEAARLWAGISRPYDCWRARHQAALILVEHGHDPPVDRLQRIVAGFTALGARRDALDAINTLQRAGVEVRRPWRGGRRGYGDDLSPRERQVARLLLDGLTNRQIAEALYLSPKTVARHVDSAMRKLAVRSRTALAVKVVQLGLVSDAEADADPA